MVELQCEPLAAWMDTQGLGEGPLRDVQPLVGGTQNVVLTFKRAEADYVLRRPPYHPREGADETMRREALILTSLAGTTVPHPRLIAACEDTAVLGCVFYLMDRVDGFNPMEGPLPEPYASDRGAQHAIGLQMVDALVALSAVDVTRAPLRDLGRADGWIERQVPRWIRRLDAYRSVPGYEPPVPDVTAGVGDWLTHHRPRHWQPGLVHGDYHLANVMVRTTTPGLAAVVDWELASVGDPLLDLGHLLATWPTAGDTDGFPIEAIPGLPTREQLIERYAQAGTRDLDDLTWFRVLAGFRMAAVLEATYAHSLQGSVPADQGARFRRLSENLLVAADALR